MPKFGLAHRLLSSRHPDTSPPAGGADPDDGQVVTWSDALRAFHAADPAGGVTDHGALTGLVPDDDHTQYALADKSRPSPWVAAGDLTARSLADLGTKDHHLLADLDHDDHSIYAYLAGRAGGQTLYGGTGSHDNLTLHSTLHATPGYIRLQDDLQLLSDVLRGSDGVARLGLAAASPHVSLTGDLDVSGDVEVGSAPFATSVPLVNIGGPSDESPAIALYAMVTGNRASDSQLVVGLYGGAQGQGTPVFNMLYGLYFQTLHATPSPCASMGSVYAQVGSAAAGTGAITAARGIQLPAASWVGSKPATVYAIDVAEQGHASVGTAYGLQLVDQTATTVRLLELGPAVPYLRLLGGANPAANESNLSLKLGSTLKQITEYDADSAGAGYRALRVPN